MLAPEQWVMGFYFVADDKFGEWSVAYEMHVEYIHGSSGDKQ